LHHANREILQQKAELENRVQERTAELSQALNHLQETQLQLIQQEKMSALGNLVAGVAHEINNPLGCIVGNTGLLKTSFDDLLTIIDLYQAQFPQPGETIEASVEDLDLDYLREDLPKMIQAMEDGANRIQSISRSLRNFSRADQDMTQSYHLHEGIDSTIMILRHRLKANQSRPEIEIIKDYGQIPTIQCFPGQINQVFMNILANAIEALEESTKNQSFAEIQANPSQIRIKTRTDENQVILSFQDNGSGIPEAIQLKVFDHLFTTKEIGKGTGLGLAIAKQIIVEHHSGSINVNSKLGEGTEFIICLPAGSSKSVERKS
jgi:signal transduction histidine kinase